MPKGLPRINALPNSSQFIFLFFAFQPKRRMLKPINHLTLYQTTTSAWHVTFPQTAIFKMAGMSRHQSNAAVKFGDLYT
jgi:hypothetical protein